MGLATGQIVGYLYVCKYQGVLGCLTVSGSDTPRPPRKQGGVNFLVGTEPSQAKNMSFHTNSIARAATGSVS